jgi:excisionase family DNA binding protein
MDKLIDEWDALPIMLTVKDAASVLRIGRSKAYEMTTLYASSGGTQGLPCLRLGDVLRIPKAALHEFVTTGHIVQLIPQCDANATHDATVSATVSRKPARKSRTSDRAQLSLLGSD